MGWGMGTGWGMGASEMRRRGAQEGGWRAQPAPSGLTLTPQGQALGTPRWPVPRGAPPTRAGVKTIPVSDADNALADSAGPSGTAPPNREHTAFGGFRFRISAPGSRNLPCSRTRFLTASWSLLCRGWEPFAPCGSATPTAPRALGAAPVKTEVPQTGRCGAWGGGCGEGVGRGRPVLERSNARHRSGVSKALWVPTVPGLGQGRARGLPSASGSASAPACHAG